MTAMIAVGMACVIASVLAVIASRANQADARVFAQVAVAMLVSAVGLVALWGDTTAGLAMLGDTLSFGADALTVTVVFSAGLIGSALVLGLPRTTSSPRLLAELVALLVLLTLALLSHDLGVVLLAELIGTVIVARSAKGRAARGSLALSAVLLLLGGLELVRGGTPMLGLDATRLPTSAAALIGLASLLRLGVTPFMSGLTHALAPGLSRGRGLLMALPLGGAALWARIVHPALAHANLPEVTIVLLVLALIGALTATTIPEVPRSLAFTFSALHTVLLVALADADAVGFHGGELLWGGLLLAEGTLLLGFTAAEMRVGSLDVRRSPGLYDTAPKLGLMTLLGVVGLAGLPGTLNFVAEEMLMVGTSTHATLPTLLLLLTLAAVGFNALRLFFGVFFGNADPNRAPMPLNTREQVALMVSTGVMILAGILPSVVPIFGASH